VPIVKGEHQTPGGGIVTNYLPERIDLTGTWPLSKTGVSSLPLPPAAPEKEAGPQPIEAAAVTRE
jgi:hypothetical protein